ncbi:MAG: aldehyde dehydrogenase family protein [Terriglobia bacterium]
MDADLESIQEARRLVEKAAEAQKILSGFSQERIDAVVRACAETAERHAEPLARLAVEETTYGVVADKTEKNLFASRNVYEAIKDLKTVGVIREDREHGVVEIGVPAGVVAAIIPCTNPTSTAIYKALIALKGRNAIVMSPHPSAVRCIGESARVMSEAARAAGAPEGSIGCLSHPTMAATEELMRHRQTAIILATGGIGLVRAAYSSGKPALGVGPGNVPAYIHSSANIPKAVADILTGKTFDNGTICSAEQHMVVDAAIAAEVRAETERRGGYFLDAQQAEKVARVLILPNFRVNAKMVGQSATRIAAEAGFSVPAGTRALIAPLTGIGRSYPLSAEKLSPVLSFYIVRDVKEGADVCRRFLEFGGMGHTMSIHATDDRVIRELALEMPAFRLVVNSPAPHGSIGYSTDLNPAMSLGCGTPGGNITTDNIGPYNLINIKRLAYEQRPVNRLEDAAKAAPVRAAVIPAPAPVVARLALPKQAAENARAKGPLDRETVRQVVEKVLNEHRQRTTSAASGASAFSDSNGPSAAASPTSCECQPGAKPVDTKSGPSKAPAPVPVDFVSEEDVRIALRNGAKIYTGPKTIITPSARDLGNPAEVFVTVR